MENKPQRSLSRQEALDICHAYYCAKGYSEKHCCDSLDYLDDKELLRICKIIEKENENV